MEITFYYGKTNLRNYPSQLIVFLKVLSLERFKIQNFILYPFVRGKLRYHISGPTLVIVDSMK